MDPTREEILAGYNRAGQNLSFWLQGAPGNELRRQSNGTRWTNEELLFHMVFGYMVVRALTLWSMSSAASPNRSAGDSPRS